MVTLASDGHRLELEDLYERMWALGIDDTGDGSRLFKPRPGQREALKWLIEDLSGARADPRNTMRANNALRRQAHDALLESGWAERLNQVAFRLLLAPQEISAEVGRQSAGSTRAPADFEEGVRVTDVAAEDAVSSRGVLRVAGLEWSNWLPLTEAANRAPTTPGVYTARSRGQLVYVGMAGERRGHGLRGRLRIYARGRGAVSGLGEAALDRALADPAWVSQQLTSLLTEGPSRAKRWATAALLHAGVEVCWASAPDSATARAWEAEALMELEELALWNRARPSRGHQVDDS